MRALVVLILAFGSVSAVGQTRYPYDVVSTVVLPKGDVQAGRQAFQELLQLQDTSDVAAAIIAPSHSLSIRTGEAVKAELSRQGLSPMGDFSRAMTVRQLADLLAYLRTVR